MLGNVTVPGSLDAFREAMERPWGNIMRRRRDVRVEDLPIESVAIPWYGLGQSPAVASPKPSRTLAYAAADYFVQDAGSLLALAVAQADTSALRGKLICDLCAAPGGKASALVEAVQAEDGEGFVLANEVIRGRLGALQLNLARTGSDRYAISSLDPEALADQLPGAFDVVVVDAPCSGQALIARGKQNRSALSTSQIEHSASRQRRILDAALKLLRDGGTLVYSTCTFSEAENEAQVSRLVDRGAAEPFPLGALDSYRSGEASYRLWPHVHACAGSFAARLRVSGNQRQGSERRSGASRRVQRPADWHDWFEDHGPTLRLWQLDSRLIGWPDDAPPWVESIAIAGPELAHRTGQTWKPAHAAALRRVESCTAACHIDLDAAEAKRYLRGETIAVQTDGWQVARYRGRPLGWIKGSAGIGKNHLLASARTRGELA
jgi:16S rRNA C967 or C1407 C5-methylase (RsmB/RsmF family)/NOL1/NOP2/fmu family ribosome biogenesis protein